MQDRVALRVHIIRPAVSYPGVGRFRRAETGILGMEQTGARVGPHNYFSPTFPLQISLPKRKKGARLRGRPLQFLADPSSSLAAARS